MRGVISDRPMECFEAASPALGGAGPNWDQFQSTQVPSQLAPRSVLVCT